MLIPWVSGNPATRERLIGKDNPSAADTLNRALRAVMTASGADPDGDFQGFALAGISGMTQAQGDARYLKLSGGTVAGTVTATRFIGDGSGLTNLPISAGGGALTPTTLSDETGTIPGSRRWVAGHATVVNTGVAGQIKLDVAGLGAADIGDGAFPGTNSFANPITVAGQLVDGTTVLSAAQKTGLIGAADTALHFHAADRARANHTGTQSLSTIAGGVATGAGYTLPDLTVTGPLTASGGVVGNIAVRVASGAANVVLTASDQLLIVENLTGNITITVPAASAGAEAWSIRRRDTSAFTVTILKTGADTLVGTATIVGDSWADIATDGVNLVLVFQPGGTGSVAWTDITGKPATFAPSAHAASHHTGGGDPLAAADIGAAPTVHTHAESDITSIPWFDSGNSGGAKALTYTEAHRRTRVNLDTAASTFTPNSIPDGGQMDVLVDIGIASGAITWANGGGTVVLMSSDVTVPATVGSVATFSVLRKGTVYYVYKTGQHTA